jgi:hypothetical protein
MKKIYQYKCTLLSDVILTSMASTEGYKESLNYISGTKFMGIVAKIYKDYAAQKKMDLFHNGTVHFGDATPMIDGNETTVKVPFSWSYAKGGKLSDSIYLHHKLDSTNQLRQAREGYFSPNTKSFITLEQGFSIKSAYDPETRRTKEGQMYGYFSLKKGTTWAFEVQDNSGQYADEIKQLLIGKHRIGKSKSAEYGLVEITYLSEKKEENPTIYQDEIIVYAQSNLCFYDDFGKCTAVPKVEQLVGTKNAKIDWAKSQVRSRNYQTWNVHRKNRDADRLIIESGSTFLIKLNEPINSTFLNGGVGSHKTEGFGKVLINPDFLMSETENLSFSLKKGDFTSKRTYAFNGNSDDDDVFKFLENRKIGNDFDYKIDKKVNDFIRDKGFFFKGENGKGVTNSQWGVLRNYAKNAENKEFFEKFVLHKDSGFLHRGQSESVWRANGRREKLEQYLNTLSPDEYLPFVVKLSNQMAKIK